MMFVVTLAHTPELCPARKEFSAEFTPWLTEMNARAKDLGITSLGSCSCPTEYTFYFILQAKEYKSITAIFAGIVLENHTGRISPVNTLQESAGFLIR